MQKHEQKNIFSPLSLQLQNEGWDNLLYYPALILNLSYSILQMVNTSAIKAVMKNLRTLNLTGVKQEAGEGGKTNRRVSRSPAGLYKLWCDFYHCNLC